IGGTSLTSSFSIDVSDELIRLGSGSGLGAKLDFYSSNGNSVRFEMTTSDILRLNNGGFHFNQASEAVNFIVEGNTDTNLFFASGSADRIGIGTNNPSSFKLQINGNVGPNADD